MNLALAYDVETNGMPIWNEPSSDPRQPHLVQLAAHLVDVDARRIIQTIDLIAEPDGWEIPDDVAEIHGITTEHAMEVGLPENVMLDAFICLWNRCDFRVAHNETFDSRLIRIAIKRHFGDDAMADLWKAGTAECTCNMATPIVNLPPTAKMRAAGRHTPKRANLSEAYKHFTGQELEDAHSAIADVNACLAVWYAMKDQEAA